MEDLLDYIENVVGKKPNILEPELLNVPRHLSLTYTCDFIEILDFECLMIQMKTDRLVIDTLLKHLNIFKMKTEKIIVMIFNYLTPEQRAKLINNKIPFIVPKIQMYLPFVFLDFRRETLKSEVEKIKKFTPSTQLVFLYIFYSQKREFHSKEIESQCKISAMTVNRTLKILANLKIIKMIGKTSNAKYKVIKSNKDMFQLVKNFLINPIRNRIYVKGNRISSDFLPAGEYALSKVGMLSNNKKQYAIDTDSYKEIKKRDYYYYDQEEIFFDNPVELQIWAYDPKLVNDNMVTVDILSLYMSLINIDDERIQIELEKLLIELLEETDERRHSNF